MDTNTLEREEFAVLELFPPEETIPVNFDLLGKQISDNSQSQLGLGITGVCGTTRCGPLGSYKLCGC